MCQAEKRKGCRTCMYRIAWCGSKLGRLDSLNNKIYFKGLTRKINETYVGNQEKDLDA